MQGSHKVDVHADLKSESVWFKTKLVSQFLTLSFLLTQPFYLSYIHAAPIGGEVVGGTGTINQNDLTTTINQTTQNLAIDWQSFNVDTNERVQFIQPDTTSIALNRILGNNGSTIQGQIDANGQVILVNPNGVFFTSTATINVGGLVASSLNMTPSDFMNGNYVFNEVIGTDGVVINSGIINASVGGNVALIGKQVKNDGLISAKLGSVILAAGKQSILTFDNQGLIGVQVTKEVLQNEIGLEEAVINSGEINASGGRVLLTASTSHDVFSQVVNTGVLDQATSVVVNDDGTFTLGTGADVLNTGSIDVSTDVNTNNTARIVLLGENVTSSGRISANVVDGQTGEIELHAKDKMLLTENSITSAQALSSGRGGLIKVLGDKVGLFDSAQVNASGANGGGDILIGGDQQGLNSSIRNANFIYLGENTSVNADATLNSDGGKIITFAKDTARIHASLFARGGLNGGNGGFIETSGLRGFEISKAPDVSAVNGNGGLWLIDPYNIIIVDTAGSTTNVAITSPSPPNQNDSIFTSNGNSAVIDVSLIENGLGSGDVEIITGGAGTEDGNITFDASLDYDDTSSQQDRLLSLVAHNDIIFTENATIFDSNGTNRKLNIKLEADSDRLNGGNVLFSSTTTGIAPAIGINTNGGDFEIVWTNNFGSYIDSQPTPVTHSGLINTSGGDFIVTRGIDFDSSNIDIDVGTGKLDLDGVTNTVILGDAQGIDLRVRDVVSVAQAAGTSLIFDDARIRATSLTNSIVLLNTNNDFNSIRLEGPVAKVTDLDGIQLDDGTSITDILLVNAGGNITDGGAISIHNSAPNTNAEAVFNTTGSVVFSDSNNNFDQVNFFNASSANIRDNSGGISIAANNGTDPGEGGIAGNLTIQADSGDITSYGEINSGTDELFYESVFTVNNGNSITLDNSAINTFNSRVQFIAASGNINNISLIDDTALKLGSVDVTGNLNVTAKSITQDTAGIIVAGSTTLDSSGDITLTDNNNNFNNLTVSNGEVTSIYDSNEIRLISSNTNNSLSLEAGGDISLVGDITTNTNLAAVSADVTFTGDVKIDTATNGGTVTIDTSASDGSVYFSAKVDNIDSVTPKNNLAIKSGNGDVTVVGNIGSTESIGSLLINKGIASTTATVSVNQIRTRMTSAVNNESSVDITAGTINLSGDIETDIGSEGNARGVTLNGDVVLANDVILDTNASTSDGSVIVTGTLISGTSNQGLTIDTGTGTIDLQQALGGLTTDTALTFLDINSGVTVGSNINLAGVRTLGGTDVIDVKGTTITLSGDLISNANNAGGDIQLDGNILLDNSITITSDASGGTGSKGQVDITGTINSDITTSRGLTINSDNNDINLGGIIGGSQALQKVELVAASTGTTINVHDITTSDATVLTNAASTENVESGVYLNAATIVLAGDITSNTTTDAGTESGSVTVNGAAVLGANVTIDTYLAGTTTGGDVTFSSTIDADDAANDRDFSINAGNAVATITGIVGATDAVNSFFVTSASTTNINEINTQTGGIDITSGIINLYGNLNTKALDDAGQISLVGAVNLNSDTTFDTEGNTSDASIFIVGSVNNTSSRALILNAGSADVTMTGTAGAGAGTALTSLNVIGENVDIGHVTSIGNIDITGNNSIDLFGNLTSNSDFIDLQNGAVTIYDDVILSVTGSNTVTVDGTINADLAANDHSFTVNAGSGDVTFNGDIGLIQAVQGIGISTTGTANIQNVNTRSGGVVITSDTLNLAGSIDTTNDVTTGGEVSLTQANLNFLANININTNSATGIDGNISILDPLPPTGMLGNDYSFDLDAGDGTVNLTTNLTDLSSFSVTNSLTTTLNGVTTNNGTITVNADGDITLSGTYDSGTADQVFSADADYNRSGLLSLDNTSVFSGNNITFSSYTLNANAISVTAVDTVTFNNTLGSIAIGDDYLFAQSILNNTFLDKVTANTLQVSSDNSFVMLSGADLSDNSYSLELDARYIYAYAVDSQLNDLNATATNSIYLYKNITASNDISLNSPVIYSYNNNPSTEITSTSGSIDITGDIAGYAALNLNAVAGSVSILGNTNVSLSNSFLLNANVVNHDNILAINNINIISGGGYTQTGSLESTTGNISIVANSGNIDLDYNVTNSGTISVEAVSGSINDNNGGAVNIETSGEINLTATGGIGHNDPLEIITNGTSANLIAINNGSGNIEITNTGNITLTDITNNASNSAFIYTGLGGDVTITKVTLDKNFNNTNAIADFNMTNGDVLGDPNSIKHIEANTASFDMNATGSIGDVFNNEPLIVEITYKLTDINSLSTYIKYFEGRAPFIYEGANEFKNKALQAIENLSGQQLIDVEALADVDEAIFTDVRNYSSSDIALMMPSDQRYTEDEEDDEEEKLKREEYINTVH